jgi:hypothetical protein
MANEHEHRDNEGLGAKSAQTGGDRTTGRDARDQDLTDRGGGERLTGRDPEGADRINERQHPAQPEQTRDGFEQGYDQEPDSPEENEVGRFSTGEEQTPKHTAEKEDIGRFSTGEEQLPETDEKTDEGNFATGTEQIPDH